MAAPDQRPRVVEQCVAGAFERDVPGPGRDFEALGLEPGAERTLLRFSFLGREMADDGGPAYGQAGVGGENHVGQARRRRDKGEFGFSRQKAREVRPLPYRQRIVRLPNLILHPGVDGVIDTIMRRRAHQHTRGRPEQRGLGFLAGLRHAVRAMRRFQV